MSVRVKDRNESKVEFLDNFHRLRSEVELLLMRDFGLKKRKYDVALMEEIYEMTDDQKEKYESLMNELGARSNIVDKYPAWLIDNWRDSIMKILDNIGIHIELANSTYALIPEEWAMRRTNWDKAIGYCNALKDKLHDIMYCTKKDITLGQFDIIAKKLKAEINLLKGVRKSDYKRGSC